MTAQTTARPLTTFDLMDGMRAAAAITVLLAHERNLLLLDAAGGLSPPWKLFYFLTGFGHQAVMIFFVLSGYWIAKTVSRRSTGEAFDWADYAIDRVSRLWIVLLPALLLGGILDCIGAFGVSAPLYQGVQGTNTVTWDVASRLSPQNFAGCLVFLQGLLVKPFGSNGPLWSLANEFWYYVWFPPLYQLVRRRRASIVAIIVALVTMIVFRSLLPGFVCWLLGAGLFFLTQRSTPAVRPRPLVANARAVAACAVFLIVLGLSRLPLLPLGPSLTDIAVSSAFAVLLFALIHSSPTYPRWLRPLCEYGRNSSFSLYLVHFPLVVLAAAFLTPVHRLSPSGGLLLGFTGISLIALLYGYGVSRLTEAHTASLRRWLRTTCLRAAT